MMVVMSMVLVSGCDGGRVDGAGGGLRNYPGAR